MSPLRASDASGRRSRPRTHGRRVARASTSHSAPPPTRTRDGRRRGSQCGALDRSQAPRTSRDGSAPVRPNGPRLRADEGRSRGRRVRGSLRLLRGVGRVCAVRALLRDIERVEASIALGVVGGFRPATWRLGRTSQRVSARAGRAAIQVRVGVSLPVTGHAELRHTSAPELRTAWEGVRKGARGARTRGRRDGARRGGRPGCGGRLRTARRTAALPRRIPVTPCANVPSSGRSPGRGVGSAS
jgi:hypothetical protein